MTDPVTVAAVTSGYEQWGAFGVLCAILIWFLRASLTTLDSRLGDIATRISETGKEQRSDLAALATEHRHEIEALAAAHRDAMTALAARVEALTDRLLERAVLGRKE